jgi:diacylglycerol kinase family enzyme
VIAILCNNPTAGLEAFPKEDLIAALKLARFDSVYCSTKDDDFSDQLHQPADLIVVAGGDGTVAKVVKNMPDRSVPIAIIPLGSANNIARSFGIAGPPHQIAESWDLHCSHMFRVGAAQGPWGERQFVEGVGLGAIAEAMNGKVTSVDGAAKLIKGRKALRAELKKAEPVDATIAIDGYPLDGDFVAVECLNISYTGPGLPLPRGLDFSDGKLAVVVVRLTETEAMRTWLKAPQAHRLPVPITMGRSIELIWNDVTLRLDDDLADAKKGLQSASLQLEEAAVRLLVSHPRAPARKASEDML